jgi:hypothetical protein
MVQGIYFNLNCILEIGWDSKSGAATSYGLGGLGLEPQWDGILHIVLISPGAHPSYCTMGIGSFPEGKAAGVWCWTHTPNLC